MKSETTLRTFIALELPPPLQAEIRRVQNTLEQQLQTALGSQWDGRMLRWTRPEAVHLTLRFLGATAEAEIPALHRALAKALAQEAPFELQAGGLGCFPNPHRPQVVWLGIHEDAERASEPLTRIQEKVDKTVQTFGFTPENRPFRPHLTLARTARQAKNRQLAALGAALADLPAFAAGRENQVSAPFHVHEVIHFQSKLPGRGRGSPVYTPLARIPLGG